MTQVHAAAQIGFTREAQAYARGRPQYPAQLLSWLCAALGLAPGKTVLDLGAGTGKFTRLLVQTGAEVIAVDPVAAMLEQLAQSLPAVQQYVGSAEAIPLETASLDAVTCAQAFHWFATQQALAEIERVLRPGGKLALVWNVRDESVDWVRAITDIITPFEGDAPRFYKGDWRKPFANGRFSALTQASFPYRHDGPAQEVILDRFLSVSFIAALPAPAKDKVAGQLRELVATHPELRGRETISFPYQTQAYCCSRLD